MTEVTCAIIRNENNDVLIVQRGENSDHPLKWEFPGGKIKAGESHEECIVREIREELEMDIIICSLLEPVEYDYGFRQIKLIPFVCDTLKEEPVLSEHISYRWIMPGDLRNADLQEADVIVAEKYLRYIEFKGAETSESCREAGKEESPDGFDKEELVEIIDNLMYLKQVNWLAETAFANPAVCGKLFEYSFSSDERHAFRASWVLSKVYDRHPEIIKPYLNDIIRALEHLTYTGVIRSFMRILSMEDMKNLSREGHGILANYSIDKLNSPSTPVAIKAYSMEILYRLSVIYPELCNEIAALVRSAMEEGSPGIVAKGKKILRKISEITSDS